MIEFWAEAGPCENSVEQALEYARKAAEAGASALKVQWYRADLLVTRTAPRYDNTSGGAPTQYENCANSIWPYTRWKPVMELCAELGIEFIPSVFDMMAVDVAHSLGVKTIKIASGDLTYHELIQAAAEEETRVALSTGAATIEEIELAVDWLGGAGEGSRDILMACHLEYPTPYQRANIARTYALQAHFPFMVPGFSDHTPGIDTVPLIVATGCQVIEKHFTLVPGVGGDSDFALAPHDLRNAIHKVQGTLAVMGNAEVAPDASEQPARDGARRSPYARVPIPAGQEVKKSDIAILRPYYGLVPDEAFRIVGTTFEQDIEAGGEFPQHEEEA